jgi:small subunit ribosomal protein S7
MSRKFKRQGGGSKPDYRYKSGLVTEFINNIVRQGKKRTAESIFYGAMDIIGQKTTEEDPLTVFKKAVDNVKPTLEVKSRRIGGANYQVPVEVPSERRASLAIRWIITFTKERSEKSMAEKLAAELLQAYKNEGSSVRKKIDTHKMAEANKAFAHFRW